MKKYENLKSKLIVTFMSLLVVASIVILAIIIEKGISGSSRVERSIVRTVNTIAN